MKTEKLKTLKELIDSFDNGYYVQKNDELQQQIDNISNGDPKEIKRLQNEIKDNREKAKALGQAITQLQTAAGTLERLAEQDLLLFVFSKLVKGRNKEELKETKIYEENATKYDKLYMSSREPITHSQHKISKEMYQIIKKNLHEYSYGTRGGYQSIDYVFQENRIDLSIKDKDKAIYNIGDRIFKDFRKDYIEDFSKLAQLGVDVSSLEYATKKIEGKLDSDSLTVDGEAAFSKLKSIEGAKKTHIDIRGGYSKLIEIKEKYTEIEELSRETWYIEKVLEAFIGTVIAETEMYKGLQDLVKKQGLELSKLTREADKLYEKTGLETKIKLIEQLEELYNKMEELGLEIAQLKQAGNYSQTNLIEQEYYKVRYEMIKILKDNPDLNNPKYNIDIEKIIKQEMEMFEPEIKKETTKEAPSYIKTDEEEIFVERTAPKTQIASEPTIEKTDNVEQIPTHIQTKDEEIFVDKAYIKEPDKVESLELDSNLQTHRTMHYQNYMREKVLNSDLGKLSFSAYLESVAPHLTELINIEKERERLARTIYKDYLKYYSSLENKEYAVDFYEFAENNYGINNVDVPIEHDEEYKGMMKR